MCGMHCTDIYFCHFFLIHSLVELNVDRGMSWENATTRADNYKGKHDGFYVSKRDMYGKKLFLLATQKEGSSHLFTIAR